MSVVNRAKRLLRPFREPVGAAALRVASKANRRTYIPLEYPPSSSDRPRYGYGRPPHEGLRRLLAEHDDTFRAELTEILGFRRDLAAIEARAGAPGQPHWLSEWLLGLDGASIYSYVRRLRPKRYLEVGSGVSTMFAARAKADGGLTTSIVSIDPSPRRDVDALCDRVIRAPLEDCDLTLFDQLEPGDIVFVDDSHRVFMNSDVATFFLDVLPRIPHGVLVGIHDILWPDDYLPEWAQYYWSEQYLLASYLLAGCLWIEPVLACNHASLHPDLRSILEPLWREPNLSGVDRRGFVFWLRINRSS
jgi:predicted O-methyltransferase YrrM